MSATGFTPRLDKAIVRARGIAADFGVVDDQGRPVVGTEHLVLAVLDDEYAVPTQALADRYDVGALKAEILRLMRSPGYQGRIPPP
ncbi:hypothetical protein [Nocardiopsis baichengensis]|uniref:hypothetical protein n=1 Tax=Nocardiopsis baichengensis TaxID=280240 RepID=UPI001EF9D27F|nr:hypothetical protein [Nocardiopsis baichengensis]